MKTALVIGASRGIGREFTRQLLADGWKVYATARSGSDLAALRQLGAHVIKLDVANTESLSGLAWPMDGVALDLALYVAGIFGPRHHATIAPTVADFDQVMHTNVRGAMQLIPMVVPMVEAARGRFVCISSNLSSIGEADSSGGWLYRASKAALNMAVKSAAHDYPNAILAAISPGPSVRTDMGGPDGQLTAEESVRGMLRVIASLDEKDSGSFRDYSGAVLRW